MAYPNFSRLTETGLIVKNASTAEDWKRPGRQQKEAARLFPKLVEASRLELWRPGDSVSKTGTHAVLGVASYSLPEMYLLDALHEWLASPKGPRVRISVFNAGNCTREDLPAYVPDGTGKIKSTPYLWLWIDGKVSDVIYGYAGIRDYFQLEVTLQRLMKAEETVGRQLARLEKRRGTGFIRR